MEILKVRKLKVFYVLRFKLKNDVCKFYISTCKLIIYADELKLEADSNVNETSPQPKIFDGTLKHYQLRGMNWLVNLFNQVGIMD